jgi:hypothetical protein
MTFCKENGYIYMQKGLASFGQACVGNLKTDPILCAVVNF